jgi:uncharacterized protein (TIGR02996 family)
MDPAHAPFLAAILADVDSDAPRLRYADFLDETGDPTDEARAEFIRVQCALEGMSRDDPRYAELCQREKELLEAHWRTWFEPVREALGVPAVRSRHFLAWKQEWPTFALDGFHGDDYFDPREHAVRPTPNAALAVTSYSRFRRGFVDRLIVRGRNAPSAAIDFDRLFRSTPLTELDVQKNQSVASLAGGWCGCTLRSLALCPAWGESLQPLAEAPFADRLRELRLVVWEETDDPSFVTALRVLTGPNRFAGLRHLDLQIYNRWFDLPELIGSSLLTHLEELTIGRPLVSIEFLRGLLRHEVAPRLRSLTVKLCEDVPAVLMESLRSRFGENCRLHFHGA